MHVFVGWIVASESESDVSLQQRAGRSEAAQREARQVDRASDVEFLVSRQSGHGQDNGRRDIWRIA